MHLLTFSSYFGLSFNFFSLVFSSWILTVWVFKSMLILAVYWQQSHCLNWSWRMVLSSLIMLILEVLFANILALNTCYMNLQVCFITGCILTKLQCFSFLSEILSWWNIFHINSFTVLVFILIKSFIIKGTCNFIEVMMKLQKIRLISKQNIYKIELTFAVWRSRSEWQR